jgi:hypothetical protein
MQVSVSLTVDIEASASISEMEEQIQEAGQQAMRRAMKEAVRQWEDQQGICSYCGQAQGRLEGTTRRVIATCFGRVTVQRRRFRCLACGRRSCPANRLVAVLKRATMTPALREAARLSGCRLSLSSGGQFAQETEWSANQRGGDPSAHQSSRQAASRAAARGGGASLHWSNPGAANAGRIGWRLGVQPRTAGRDGGQSRRDPLADGRLAHASRRHHVFVEQARKTKQTSQATPSAGNATLCGHRCRLRLSLDNRPTLPPSNSMPIPCARLWSLLMEPSGSRRSKASTSRKRASHSRLGTSLARGQSCDHGCGTSQRVRCKGARVSVVLASDRSLAGGRRSSPARLAPPDGRRANRVTQTFAGGHPVFREPTSLDWLV